MSSPRSSSTTPSPPRSPPPGCTPSTTSTSSHPGEVPLFGPEQVKGLEFDGVVVVEPDEILDGTPRGARLLYVAMTRAVQELAFVTTGAPELRL